MPVRVSGVGCVQEYAAEVGGDDEAGIGLRWVRLALVVVLVVGVSAVLGILELWPPSSPLPGDLGSYVAVGFITLVTGVFVPPEPLFSLLGIVAIVLVAVAALVSFIVIEVNRRRRVSILPRSGAKPPPRR